MDESTPARDERGRFAPADQVADDAAVALTAEAEPAPENERAAAEAEQQAEREEVLEKQQLAAVPATTPQDPGEDAEIHADALAHTVATNPSRTVYVMGGPMHDAVVDLLRAKHGFDVAFDHVRGVHAVQRLTDPSGEAPAAPATIPPPVEPTPVDVEAEPEA